MTDERREDRAEHEDGDDAEPEQRERVAREAAPRVVATAKRAGRGSRPASIGASDYRHGALPIADPRIDGGVCDVGE